MLSEEEKQAIERLNEILKEWQEIVNIEDKEEREIEMSLYIEEMPFEETKTVLNLISRLKKKNKKLKDKNQDLLRKLRNRVKEVKKLTKYSLYKKEFSRLNKVIKEKDKQIDLMVEYINNIQDCPLENCGADLDCENRCDNNEELTKQCWKMYFESKSKEK